MPTTTNMGLVLPTEDGSSGTWDTLLNTALDLVDGHDHSSGKGVPVKSAGIEVDDDLSFGGFAATAMKAIDFTPVAEASMAGYTCALFASSADDELYWRTAGGTNVKLTSGSSLNSALLGGFTGDYGAGDEEAEFTSGTGIYDFRVDDGTRGYIDCADIRLFEAQDGVTNAVKLKSPASLAASYTLTLPDALPGSTSLVQMSSSGAVSASNTVPGLITAGAGLTASADQHITVSGTGQYKHGEVQHSFTAQAIMQLASPNAGDGTFGAFGGTVVTEDGSANGELALDFLKPGDRIKSVAIKVSGDEIAEVTAGIRVVSTAMAATMLDSDSLTPDTGWSTITLSGNLPRTVAAGESYHLTFNITAANLAIGTITVTYDHP